MVVPSACRRAERTGGHSRRPLAHLWPISADATGSRRRRRENQRTCPQRPAVRSGNTESVCRRGGTWATCERTLPWIGRPASAPSPRPLPGTLATADRPIRRPNSPARCRHDDSRCLTGRGVGNGGHRFRWTAGGVNSPECVVDDEAHVPAVGGPERGRGTLRTRQAPPFECIEIAQPQSAWRAVNTSLRPSGDTDTSSDGVTFSGTGASNRLGEPGAVGRNTQAPIPSAIAAITTANPCHTRTDRAGIDGGGSAAIHLRACLTSRADCQRFSGSFSRQVRTTSARPRGVCGCISISGRGSSLRIDATRLACVLPVKGRVPAINSYSTTPKAKMSLRASASWPSTCSGDMYGSVPRMEPSAVRATA